MLPNMINKNELFSFFHLKELNQMGPNFSNENYDEIVPSHINDKNFNEKMIIYVVNSVFCIEILI